MLNIGPALSIITGAIILLGSLTQTTGALAQSGQNQQGQNQNQQGQNQDAAVVQPNRSVLGKTYGEWTAAWWRWADSLQATNHPLNGGPCSTGQTGQVWFLGGPFAGAPADGSSSMLSCNVPRGTFLLFPLLNAECSNVEPPPFFGATDAARRDCARSAANDIGVNTLRARIDGDDVDALSRFRFASPPFDFTMPAHDNILGLEGTTHGRSGSDGYWLMIEPLSIGHHTIHFEARLTSGPGAGYAQKVTYRITVS